MVFQGRLNRGDKYNQELSYDCQNCSFQLVCAGGCPVYRENGKSKYCEFYKSTLPKVYELIAKEKYIKMKRRQAKQSVRKSKELENSELVKLTV